MYKPCRCHSYSHHCHSKHHHSCRCQTRFHCSCHHVSCCKPSPSCYPCLPLGYYQ